MGCRWWRHGWPKLTGYAEVAFDKRPATSAGLSAIAPRGNNKRPERCGRFQYPSQLYLSQPYDPNRTNWSPQSSSRSPSGARPSEPYCYQLMFRTVAFATPWRIPASQHAVSQPTVSQPTVRSKPNELVATKSGYIARRSMATLKVPQQADHVLHAPRKSGALQTTAIAQECVQNPNTTF